MDKSFVIAVVLCLCIWAGALTAVFQQSLPMWCANPQGNGNWIVQPFCK